MILKMKNNDIYFKKTLKQINLEPFKEFLKPISKPKTKDFEFFNNVNLLGIEFKIFNLENKNTKKTLVHYLYQLHNISNFILNNNTIEPLAISDFIQSIMPKDEKIHPNLQQMSKTIHKLTSTNFNTNDKIFEPLNTLMKNKEIMNIANEVTLDIAEMKIDPMMLMSSLLSGNLDTGEIGSFINKLTNKITSKIKNGDIDENLLKEQTNSFINGLNEQN